MTTTGNDLLGALRPEGGRAAVRFERTYDSSREDLWSALTEPDRLTRWFAPVSGDLTIGGGYTVDFGHDLTSGTVVSCEPPQLLELTWDLAGEPTSRIVVTLEERDGMTHLVLDHAQLPVDQVGGYSAGWHAYLARLFALLRREDVPEWATGYAAELETYRGLAAAAQV
jgi:uncharacterized protein YndB with AHSA1/START domain